MFKQWKSRRNWYVFFGIMAGNLAASYLKSRDTGQFKLELVATDPQTLALEATGAVIGYLVAGPDRK